MGLDRNLHDHAKSATPQGWQAWVLMNLVHMHFMRNLSIKIFSFLWPPVVELQEPENKSRPRGNTLGQTVFFL
jgi:hypothetical protein